MENNKEQNTVAKPHKALKVIGIILIVLLVIIVALAYWQRDNIAALHEGLTSDPEELQSEIDENEAQLDQLAQDYDINVDALTDEEKQAYLDGTMTIDEIMDKIIENNATDGADAEDDAKAPASSKTASASSGSGTVSAQDDHEVQRLIGQLYVLRSSYSGSLNSLMASARSEYDALPEDQKTSAAKRSIISAKMSQGYAMEASCDAQVSSIISQLRARLSEIGESTSLADQCYSTYQREKQLKKSYYVSMYS